MDEIELTYMTFQFTFPTDNLLQAQLAKETLMPDQ